MSRRDSLLAALVGFIWGFNFIVIDWGMADVPPLLFAALRFVFVFFPAALFIRRPDVSWRTLAAVGGLVSLGQFGFLYASIAAGMPPGLAALVLQAQVVFTVVIAAVALRERPSRGQTVGVVLGAAGLLLVAGGRDASLGAGALALCLLAAFSWGAGNVVTRAAGVSGGLALVIWSAAVVPIPLLVLSFAIDGPGAVGNSLASLSWQAITSTAYTVILASMVGYGIFNTLLARNPSAAVVPWALLAPVVAMGAAWLLLSDRPNAAEFVGGLVLVGGVLVATRARPVIRPARPPAPTAPN